jgi:hypothetical protein
MFEMTVLDTFFNINNNNENNNKNNNNNNINNDLIKNNEALLAKCKNFIRIR